MAQTGRKHAKSLIRMIKPKWNDATFATKSPITWKRGASQSSHSTTRIPTSQSDSVSSLDDWIWMICRRRKKHRPRIWQDQTRICWILALKRHLPGLTRADQLISKTKVLLRGKRQTRYSTLDIHISEEDHLDDAHKLNAKTSEKNKIDPVARLNDWIDEVDQKQRDLSHHRGVRHQPHQTKKNDPGKVLND